jgi:hypothetical protein
MVTQPLRAGQGSRPCGNLRGAGKVVGRKIKRDPASRLQQHSLWAGSVLLTKKVQNRPHENFGAQGV